MFCKIYIIRKTKCSGISEQNVPSPKRNVPLKLFFLFITYNKKAPKKIYFFDAFYCIIYCIIRKKSLTL